MILFSISYPKKYPVTTGRKFLKMKEITAQQLKQMLDAKKTIQIIDIREYHEVDSGSIEGCIHIPMAKVLKNCDKIRTDCPVIIHCRGGDRARAMAYVLETQKGFNNIYHLKGGIKSWAEKIDPQIFVY